MSIYALVRGRSRIVLFAITLGSSAWAAADPGHLAGQSRDDVAAREAMYDRYLGFAARISGGSVTPHWLGDGSRFWFMENGPDSAVAIFVDPEAGTQRPVFDIARLRTAVAEALGHRPGYNGLPFQSFDWTEEPGEDAEGRVRFVVDGIEFELALVDYALARTGRSEAVRERLAPRVIREAFPVTASDIMELLSPDRRWFARDDDGDLWLRAVVDDRLERLTDDAEEWFGWSVLGAQWSPASTKLAVMKSDERHVHKVPLVHWLKPHEEVEWAALTKAGGPLPFPEIHIVDALSKKDVRVETGNEREVYLGILGWLPDGSELVFSRISRRFDRFDVMAADPETGVSRVIMTETQPTFIKGISINPALPDLYTPLSDGERFLFISERDGWDHIYLYDMDGTLIRRLTSGAWPVRQIVAVDEETGWVYFTAHAETDAIDPDLGVARLYDTNLYRVGLEGRPIEKLTEATGEHTIALSPSKRFFLDTHSTPERSPVVELRQADGRLIRSVSQADISGLADLEWSPPEEFVVKAADGTTDLYGVLFKPWDFDPAKQYPVIDYIYGGPYRTQAPYSFVTGTGTVAQALAQLGYVVMMVDARGTPERGKAFQDVVYGNFGRHEIPDHVAALHGLAADRPYLDTERVGMFGGSWGGYMTVRAMVTAPETYDVGVSLYPVVDMYDHMSQAFEPYMGLPEDRPEAFEYGSSLRLADQLEGDLLLIHGTSDVNATFSATMKMVDALNRAGKPYDLIVFPEENHGLVGHTLTYWLQTLKRYFQEHLPPQR